MSAAIRHLYYKPELEELSLWFGPEFRRYKYFGVPLDLYEALRDAPSRGRFFNQFIKGQFECRRIETADRRKRPAPDIRSAF